MVNLYDWREKKKNETAHLMITNTMYVYQLIMNTMDFLSKCTACNNNVHNILFQAQHFQSKYIRMHWEHWHHTHIKQTNKQIQMLILSLFIGATTIVMYLVICVWSRKTSLQSAQSNNETKQNYNKAPSKLRKVSSDSQFMVDWCMWNCSFDLGVSVPVHCLSCWSISVCVFCVLNCQCNKENLQVGVQTNRLIELQVKKKKNKIASLNFDLFDSVIQLIKHCS